MLWLAAMNKYACLCVALILGPACDKSDKDQQARAEAAQREAQQISIKAQTELTEKAVQAAREATAEIARAEAKAGRDGGALEKSTNVAEKSR